MIDQLVFIKVKTFCFEKETALQMKRQITDWEKIFVRHRSDKRTGIQNMQRTLKSQQENQ